MVYEIVNLGNFRSEVMATSENESRAIVVMNAFKTKWPNERYGVRQRAEGSTGRDGSAMDSERRRSDAAAMGDGTGFTVGEYHGTKAVFYGGQHIFTLEKWHFDQAALINERRIG